MEAKGSMSEHSSVRWVNLQRWAENPGELSGKVKSVEMTSEVIDKPWWKQRWICKAKATDNFQGRAEFLRNCLNDWGAIWNWTNKASLCLNGDNAYNNCEI